MHRPGVKKKSQTTLKGVWQPIEKLATQTELSSFDNFSGFNAASAYLHPSISSRRELDPDGLKIRVETPPRFVVSVRYVVSKLRAFPAYVAALCHKIASG